MFVRLILILMPVLLALPTERAMAALLPPTILAAASLKPALDELAASGALGTPAPRLIYAASSALAHQIEQDAPADIYISADEDWMDDLAKHDAIVADSRHDLLGNALMLVALKTSPVRVDLAQPQSLHDALGKDDRLSIALPKSVPAGRYAQESLTTLGLWNSVASRLAMNQDVRAALKLVVIGEAPLGIVYRSDAVSEPRVRVVATFPATSHKPIVYPVAIMRGHDSAAIRALLAALQSSRAQATFRRYGFDAPPR
ncbi:MAG: molybdate ABC transporter substrate-binding protein [Rhodanobacteraceae bacterium]